MNLIIKSLIGIVVNGAALYGLVYAIDEITYTGGIKTFILAGIVLGVLNAIVKPVLKILSLPLVFLTGGLFLIVINAGILWFTSYLFDIAKFRDVSLVFPNWGSYVIGATIFGVLNWILHLFIKKD